MNDIYAERLEQTPEYSNVEISTLMRESYDFLKGKGLSEEQIAGVIANEYQESRCDPKANNNNVSFGIFQWKPDRIEKIKKATGIDIYTASHLEQLKALWWEMTEDPFEKKVYPLLKQAKSANEAAGIFVNEFERPADKI
jgi:Phage tail lysozyme